MITVQNIKDEYLPNTRLELIHMDDPFPVLPGTKGTVEFVDDIGQIHVDWDGGSTLALNVHLDKFKKIQEE